MTSKPNNFLSRFFQWLTKFIQSLFGRTEVFEDPKPKAVKVTVRTEQPDKKFLVVFFDSDASAYVGGSIVLGNNEVTMTSLSASSDSLSSSDSLYSSSYSPADFVLGNRAIDVTLKDAAGAVVSQNQAMGGRPPEPSTLTLYRNSQGETTSIETNFGQNMETYGNSNWFIVVSGVQNENNVASYLEQLTFVDEKPNILTSDSEHWRSGTNTPIDWDIVTSAAAFEANIVSEHLHTEYSDPVPVNIIIHPALVADEFLDDPKPKAVKVTVRVEQPLDLEVATTFYDFRFSQDASPYAGNDSEGNPNGQIQITAYENTETVFATFTSLTSMPTANQVLTAANVSPADYVLPEGEAVMVVLMDGAGNYITANEAISGVAPLAQSIDITKNDQGLAIALNVNFNNPVRSFANQDWFIKVTNSTGDKASQLLGLTWDEEKPNSLGCVLWGGYDNDDSIAIDFDNTSIYSSLQANLANTLVDSEFATPNTVTIN